MYGPTAGSETCALCHSSGLQNQENFICVLYTVGALSPLRGTFSGSEWTRLPPDVMGSCEYIE
jgi:hypothetical protein